MDEERFDTKKQILSFTTCWKCGQLPNYKLIFTQDNFTHISSSVYKIQIEVVFECVETSHSDQYISCVVFESQHVLSKRFVSWGKNGAS